MTRSTTRLSRPGVRRRRRYVCGACGRSRAVGARSRFLRVCRACAALSLA